MVLTVKVALLGFGTVGRSVYDIIYENNEDIIKRTDINIEIIRILVSDQTAYSAAIEKGLPITDQFETILTDETIDIVVEVMGSPKIAKTYISQALKSGKNVVTANKDVIAAYGSELGKIAEENGKDLFFEASVAGGVPIIRALSDSFIGDRIQEVNGILNGTTNFIMSQMNDDHQSYQEALRLSQKLGFAEADPSADVEGLDAARKLIILMKLAFGYTAKLSDLTVEGIQTLTLTDFLIAEKLGFTLKLIAHAKKIDTNLVAMVTVMLVPLDHLLAAVKNENNAVLLVGESVGETMFYGPGAGGLPTGNSIVADILAVSRNIASHWTGRTNQGISEKFDWLETNAFYFDVLLRSENSQLIVDYLKIKGLLGHKVTDTYVFVKQISEAQLSNLQRDIPIHAVFRSL